jgi:hypothetical protein
MAPPCVLALGVMWISTNQESAITSVLMVPGMMYPAIKQAISKLAPSQREGERRKRNHIDPTSDQDDKD